MLRLFRLLTFVVLAFPVLTAAATDELEVKDVILRFHQALERHDVAGIEVLVSPDIVVLENGHRSNGWEDFRDNHLIPEFKEPAAPSTWEVVKAVASPQLAWGYTKETIRGNATNGKSAVYRVWSAYVLQKSGATWKVAFLDWSVGPLPSAESKDAGD